MRLKRFLEMRGADGGRWRRICALPAFWVGLLYDRAALDAAWDLVKDLDRGGAPGAARRGADDWRFDAGSASRTVQEHRPRGAGDRPAGPDERAARMDAAGRDETHVSGAVEAIAASPV